MKRLYRFAADEIDGDASLVHLLGGKGANLAEMATLNIPVPPGFTITTDVCRDFEAMPPADLPLFMDQLVHEVMQQIAWLTEKFGYTPLLSVRSGAPVSMPGMMDTILNVGLTPDTMAFWSEKIGKRATFDSRRRLIQMFGSTAYGIDMAKYDFQLASVKKANGVVLDTDLTAEALEAVVGRFDMVFKENVGSDFPATLELQISVAVEAVFRSWMNPRAIEYRKIHKIDADMGTAVTIQAMVFGNTGDFSGTGVLFSRDASTGAKQVLGEFLPNAQGEDVVAGIRTPLPLADMQGMDAVLDDPVLQGTWSPWPSAYKDLLAITERLELHYKDMMDLEFTVQDGKLWMLQCRIGKRSAIAAFKIAAQLVNEGVITKGEAVQRLTAAQYKLVQRPRIPDSFKTKPNVVGKGASPGVAVGKVVFSSEAAVNSLEPCILVTHETCPDDIAGMHKAQGILTATGGATSHAAVVARAMDKPCIVGCTEMHLGKEAQGQDVISVGGQLMSYAGETATLCGDTGRVWFGVDVPVEDASDDPDVHRVCLWAMEVAGFSLERTFPDATVGLQTIKLAAFWGDSARLVQLLDKIAASMKPSMVVLDATPLLLLEQSDDVGLRDCFGPKPLMATWAVDELYSLLVDSFHYKKLNGMTIAGVDAETPFGLALVKAGYHVLTPATTLHDLLFGERVMITPAFLQETVGSPQAMTELMSWAHATGRAAGVMRRAVPLEYATFMALAH